MHVRYDSFLRQWLLFTPGFPMAWGTGSSPSMLLTTSLFLQGCFIFLTPLTFSLACFPWGSLQYLAELWLCPVWPVAVPESVCVHTHILSSPATSFLSFLLLPHLLEWHKGRAAWIFFFFLIKGFMSYIPATSNKGAGKANLHHFLLRSILASSSI